MDNEQLIKLCAVGDKDAIAILYRRYGSSMLRVISRYIVDEARAEDVLHDGFIVILTRIGEVRQPERLEFWMGTIMKNLCIKYLSQVDVHEILEDEGNVPDVPPIDDILSYEELQIIINRLPEGYRRIFKLAVLEGKSHKEIGRMLGIAPHSSSSQLHHARLMLQRMITERKRELGIITMLALVAGLWFVLHRADLRKATDVIARTEQTESVAESTETVISSDERSAVEESKPFASPSAPIGVSTDSETMTDAAGDVETDRPGTVTDTEANDTAADHSADNRVDNHTYKGAGEAVDAAPADTAARRAAPTPKPAAPAGPVTRRPRTQHLLKTGHIAQASGSWSIGVQGVGAAALQSGRGMLANDAAVPPADDPNKPDTVQTVEAANILKVPSDVKQVAVRSGEAEHEIPLTFGLTVGKRLSSRLTIESGLSYTLLRTRLKYYGGGVDIVRNVRNSYIGIPLKLNYRLFERSSFAVYGTLGGAVDIPVGSQFTTRASQSLNGDVVFPHLSSRAQFSALGGLGIQYSINPHFGLYFEPSLRYYFNNRSSMPTYWQDHPWSFSFPIGVRYTW